MIDALVGQSVTQLQEKLMRDAQYVIETAQGLVCAMEGQGNKGPFVITVPYGTDLNTAVDDNLSLEHKLKSLGNVEKVVVGTKNYVTIETSPAVVRSGV